MPVVTGGLGMAFGLEWKRRIALASTVMLAMACAADIARGRVKAGELGEGFLQV
jgi:hypothetical protein